jgi:hypothetical protein
MEDYRVCTLAALPAPGASAESRAAAAPRARDPKGTRQVEVAAYGLGVAEGGIFASLSEEEADLTT